MSKVINYQLNKEIDIFNDVMTKVFQLSKVNRNTYNESTEKYTNEKDSILDAVHNSLLSPFISQRAFTKEEA